MKRKVKEILKNLCVSLLIISITICGFPISMIDKVYAEDENVSPEIALNESFEVLMGETELAKLIDKTKDQWIAGIYQLQEVNDGGYIANVLRCTIDPPDGQIDEKIIVKFDKDFKIEWYKSLMELGIDMSYICSGIKVLSDGYLLMGKNGAPEYWTLKLDENGMKMGEIQGLYQNPNYDSEFVCMIQTNDQGYFIIEKENNYANNTYAYKTIKLDQNGENPSRFTFACSSEDQLYSSTQINDSSYIAVGKKNNNYWVVKFDTNGEKIWEKTYGGSGEDIARYIWKTNDGGSIIVGKTTSNDGDITGNDNNDAGWIIKIDEDGNSQWKRSLEIENLRNINLNSIYEADEGGYMLSLSGQDDDYKTQNRMIKLMPNKFLSNIKINGENIENFATDKMNYVVNAENNPTSIKVAGILADEASSMKIDGDLVENNEEKSIDLNEGKTSIAIEVATGGYTRTYTIIVYNYTAPKVQELKSIKTDDGSYIKAKIKQTSDGGYIALSQKQETGGTALRFVAIKLKEDFGRKWETVLDTDSEINYLDIQETEDGYICLGQSNDQHYKVKKLDRNGDLLWKDTYYKGSYDIPINLEQTSDGGYIIVGMTGNATSGNMDEWILKLASDGSQEWQKTFGGSEDDYATCVKQTSDGGYVIGGVTESSDGDISNQGEHDIWVIKTNPSGEKQWQKTYGGSGADTIYSIEGTQDGGYIVASATKSNNGDVSGNHGNQDCWIIKIGENGTLQWQKCFGGSGYDVAYFVEKTKDNGYVIGSATASNEIIGMGKEGDIWVFEIDEEGNVKWKRTLGFDVIEDQNFFSKTNDGGLLVSGEPANKDGNFFNNWAVKLGDDLPSSDNLLNDLKINGETVSGFVYNQYEYGYEVENQISSINIAPQLSDNKASMKMNGAVVTSEETKAISLNVGENTINIEVTAENGTTKIYTIKVKRKKEDIEETNVFLNDLSIEGETVSGFVYNQYEYEYEVENHINSINIVAELSDHTASMKMNGAEVASEEVKVISLDVGENIINIEVIEENVTSKVYTLKIKRKEELIEETNVFLRDLRIEGQTVSGFVYNQYQYGYQVENQISSINIVAKLADNTASVKINENAVGSEEIENVSLNVGQNIINIKVIATDGTTKVYTINVYRKSASSHHSSHSSLNKKDPIQKTISEKIEKMNNELKKIMNDSKKSDKEQGKEIRKILIDMKRTMKTVKNKKEAEKTLKQANNTISILSKMMKEIENQEEKEKILDSIKDTIYYTQYSITKIEDSKKITQFTQDSIRNVGKILKETNSSWQKEEELKNTLKEMVERGIVRIGRIKLDQKDFKVAQKAVHATIHTEVIKKEIQKRKQWIESIKNEMKKVSEEIAEEMKTNFVVDIPKQSEDIKKIKVSFSPELLKVIEENHIDRLSVKMRYVGLSINKDTFRDLGEEMITLEEEIVNAPSSLKQIDLLNESILNSDNELERIEGMPIIEVTVRKGKKEIRKFKQPLLLSFELSNISLTEEEVENLSVFRFNEEMNKWKSVGGRYDPITNSLIVYRMNFSKYTVLKSNKAFSDVKGHTQQKEINIMLKKGILEDEEKFSPQKTLTREEFATWVAKGFGLEEKEFDLAFEDIDKLNPHYKEIAATFTQGLITGKSDKVFDPKGSITKQEAAVVISKALQKYDKEKVPKDIEKYIAQFENKDEIASWAKESIATVASKGLSIGDDKNKYNPNEKMTKGDGAVLLYNINKQL